MAVPKEITEALDDIQRKLNQAPKYNAAEHKDKTRSRVAFWFTIGYFVLLTIALIGTPAYNAILVVHYKITDTSILLPVKDVLLTIAGILGGPIGFVVGYYFKGSEK